MKTETGVSQRKPGRGKGHQGRGYSDRDRRSVCDRHGSRFGVAINFEKGEGKEEHNRGNRKER